MSEKWMFLGRQIGTWEDFGDWGISGACFFEAKPNALGCALIPGSNQGAAMNVAFDLEDGIAVILDEDGHPTGKPFELNIAAFMGI